MGLFDWLFGGVKEVVKPRTYTEDDINLAEAAQLRFVKDEYGEYKIQFFHPLYQRWWGLPEKAAGIHEKWSILNHGSFGAYDIYKLTCKINSIDYYKVKFCTIGDIKKYLDEVGLEYDRFQRYMKEENKNPNVIY